MGLNYVLEGFNLQQILHDSKLSVPLSLSIMFVNREVLLDSLAIEEVIGKDKGLQLACYEFIDVQQLL